MLALRCSTLQYSDRYSKGKASDNADHSEYNVPFAAQAS